MKKIFGRLVKEILREYLITALRDHIDQLQRKALAEQASSVERKLYLLVVDILKTELNEL